MPDIQREPDFALIPALSPTIERVHAVRDFVAALVYGHIAYEAAVNKGIELGRQRAADRTQSAQQQGGEV